MKHTLIPIVFLLITSLGLADETYNIHQSKLTNSFSVDCGFGLGLLGYECDAGLTYRIDATFYGLRYLTSGDIKGLEIGPFGGVITHFKRPLESIWEIDAYVGRIAFDRGFNARALVGLCLTGGTLRGNFISNDGSYDHYASLQETVIGISTQGQLTYIPLDYVGVSLSYFANFNSKKIFRGFIFSVQITIH